MVGTHAGDMIGEIVLAIEMGADAIDIGKTIYAHPTLGESLACLKLQSMPTARMCCSIACVKSDAWVPIMKWFAAFSVMI